MSAVTVAELAAHLNRPVPVPASADETEMQAHIDAAEALVVFRCGPLVNGSQTFRVWPSGHSLVLPVTRVTSITSVTDPDGTLITVDPDDVNLLAGIIDISDWGHSTGPWTVVAVAGPSATIPYGLRMAVLIIAAHTWDAQRTTQPGRAGFNPGEAPVGRSPAYAIPDRAVPFMEKYMTPSVA